MLMVWKPKRGHYKTFLRIIQDNVLFLLVAVWTNRKYKYSNILHVVYYINIHVWEYNEKENV